MPASPGWAFCFLMKSAIFVRQGCLTNYLVEKQAENIPIDGPKNRQTPDTGNAGVGKSDASMSLQPQHFTYQFENRMSVNEWFQLLGTQLKETPFLQFVGVSFGVAEVLLARSNKIWLYPAGIISTVIATYTLFQAHLFAESALNIYYLIMTVYGWWNWDKKKGGAAIVSYATAKEWQISIAITIAAFGILFTILKLYTPSTVPVWDAWVSATAWAGMWLLARRKIENWIFLNISNAFAIPLLIKKELPLYALLTIFLFIVAIQGYFKWRTIVKERAMPNAHGQSSA